MMKLDILRHRINYAFQVIALLDQHHIFVKAEQVLTEVFNETADLSPQYREALEAGDLWYSMLDSIANKLNTIAHSVFVPSPALDKFTVKVSRLTPATVKGSFNIKMKLLSLSLSIEDLFSEQKISKVKETKSKMSLGEVFDQLFDSFKSHVKNGDYKKLIHSLASTFTHEVMHMLQYTKASSNLGPSTKSLTIGPMLRKPMVISTKPSNTPDSEKSEESEESGEPEESKAKSSSLKAKSNTSSRKKMDVKDDLVYLTNSLEFDPHAANIAHDLLAKAKYNVNEAKALLAKSSTELWRIPRLKRYYNVVFNNPNVANRQELWKRFIKRIYQFIDQAAKISNK